jgi:hypothetical protein
LSLLKRQRRCVGCSVGYVVASSQEMTPLCQLLCRSLCRFFSGDDTALSAAVSLSSLSSLEKRSWVDSPNIYRLLLCRSPDRSFSRGYIALSTTLSVSLLVTVMSVVVSPNRVEWSRVERSRLSAVVSPDRVEHSRKVVVISHANREECSRESAVVSRGRVRCNK